MPNFIVQTSGNDDKSDATKHEQHLSLPCLELGSYSTQDNVNNTVSKTVNTSNNDNSNINNNTTNSNNEFKIRLERTHSEDGKTFETNHMQISINHLTQDSTNPNRSLQILFAPSSTVNNDGINNNTVRIDSTNPPSCTKHAQKQGATKKVL